MAALVAVIIAISIASSGGGDNGETVSPDPTASPSPKSESDRTESPSPKSETPSAKETQEAAPGIGDPVRDGKFEFTVTRLQPGLPRIGSTDFGSEAQGQFILVHMTVKNIGSESQTFNGSDQKLFDAKDREYSADSGAAIYLDESESFLNSINPGNSVAGIVVFDVPKDVTPVKLEVHDSIFSGGATINLSES
ncbi:DUF4352 domain-containing protein [Streptomyces sp. NPDC048142]|uniref:DUF4352 domain-containing protein n=1 Tax=Streptomyces sp. NPDC048142 TaxID=3365501 RepID=UPI0037142DA0